MRASRTHAANALDRELVVRVHETTRASADAIYASLSNLRTHLEWAGERQQRRARLLSMDAADEPAVVGTEFHTTGADPMGRFDDRSVVTEADTGRAFEFVTEARLSTRRGTQVEWTNVHRYEMQPAEEGCRITYTIRVARISELPGMLVLLKVPVLRAVVLKAWARMSRRAVRNLAHMTEAIDREGR